MRIAFFPPCWGLTVNPNTNETSNWEKGIMPETIFAKRRIYEALV
jgi:hypothetical protein